MEKLTLKLIDFYNLDVELNGLVNQQTGEKLSKGLLQEKLPLVTKYWISNLNTKVLAEKTMIDELKNGLIKKYGKTDKNGSISIPMVIEELDENGNPIPVETTNSEETVTFRKKLNPDFQEFEKEFNELLQTEKEIEYNAFKLEEFKGVEASENYVIFYKFISI
jgi:hypothetical protein